MGSVAVALDPEVFERAVRAYVSVYARRTNGYEGPSPDEILEDAGYRDGPEWHRLASAITEEGERRIALERAAAVRGAQCPVCGRDGFAGKQGLDIHLSRYCDGVGLDRLVEQYLAEPDRPVGEIAAESGVSTATLYREIDRRGIPRRSAGWKNRD